ncbi:MAG: AraC family transcriptional regulator [Nevskia sp.]|nr:AraC family transcriptional regulator [Nevskia sp.]
MLAGGKHDYPLSRDALHGPHGRAYFAADCSIDPGQMADVRAGHKAVGPCSITHLRSRFPQSFNRSWSHIREDAADVAILCFLKRGTLCLSCPGGQSVANAGDVIIARSMTPYVLESKPDEGGLCEVLQLVVPTHMLRRILGLDVRSGFRMPAVGRRFAIAERILADLFEDTGELHGHAVNLLIESALCVLGDAIKGHASCTSARRTLADKRLQDVLRFIETHLSDPKLSVAQVAKNCGISSRYLSLLLMQNGTPFSALVWNKRLNAAVQWLSASRPGEATISEIAYGVGFKSAAHFSRMFKREYKVSPRQYRAVVPPAAAAEPQPCVTDGGAPRH